MEGERRAAWLRCTTMRGKRLILGLSGEEASGGWSPGQLGVHDRRSAGPVSASDVETGHDGNKSLAMTLPVVHVPSEENAMKASGISSTEFIVAVVVLGLCIAMFVVGVQLWQFIE